MNRRLPSLGEEATNLGSCGRMIGASPCGARAIWHIIWDEAEEAWRAGMACEEHALEIIAGWDPFKVHKATPECTHEKRVFLPALNRCVVPDDDGMVEVLLGEAVEMVGAE